MSNESKKIHQVGFGARVLFMFAVCFCCLGTGCVDSVSYTPIVHPSRPLAARPVNSVEVLSVTPPTRPHTNLGIFQVGMGAHSPSRTMADLIEVARQNAAEIGCDAILVTSIDVLGGKGRPANVQASCILYDDPVPASACPPLAAVPPVPRSP